MVRLHFLSSKVCSVMDIAAVHEALSSPVERLFASEESCRTFVCSLELAARWLALNLDDR